MPWFVLILLCCLALAAPAWAGFDEGVDAYERGDYEAALKEIRPLAEQGNARRGSGPPIPGSAGASPGSA